MYKVGEIVCLKPGVLHDWRAMNVATREEIDPAGLEEGKTYMVNAVAFQLGYWFIGLEGMPSGRGFLADDFIPVFTLN